MEHVLRECLIAMRLGERVGLNETERVTVYYAALLTWVGCHVDAYEQAKWFGTTWRSSPTSRSSTIPGPASC
jgi:hypothetical protein